MKISDFAVLIAEEEAGKQEISIAQIKEVLRDANYLTDGDFYKLIRKI